jgi:hypothetical protein
MAVYGVGLAGELKLVKKLKRVEFGIVVASIGIGSVLKGSM